MESFTLTISPPASKAESLQFFLSLGFHVVDPGWMINSTALEFEAEDFILEVLISPYPEYLNVSMRFALPNPPTADACFRSILLQFLLKWPSYVSFMSGTRKDLDFAVGDHAGVLAAFDEQAPILRQIWQTRTESDKMGRVRVRDMSQFMGWIE